MTPSPTLPQLLQRWGEYRRPHDIRSVSNAIAVFGAHALVDQAVLCALAHELHELFLDTGVILNSRQVPPELLKAIANATDPSDDLKWLAHLVPPSSER